MPARRNKRKRKRASQPRDARGRFTPFGSAKHPQEEFTWGFRGDKILVGIVTRDSRGRFASFKVEERTVLFGGRFHQFVKAEKFIDLVAGKFGSGASARQAFLDWSGQEVLSKKQFDLIRESFVAGSGG